MKKANTQAKVRRLRYKVIKSDKQYWRYRRIRQRLWQKKDRRYRDEIELIDLLSNQWKAGNDLKRDPIEWMDMLKADVQTASDFAKELGISKGHMSDILNYKKRLSLGLIQKVASSYNISENLLARPYALGKKKKWMVPLSQIEW